MTGVARQGRSISMFLVGTLLVTAAGLAGASNQPPKPATTQQPVPGQIKAALPGTIVVKALRTGADTIYLNNFTKLQNLKITGPGRKVFGPISLQIGQVHTFTPAPAGNYIAASTKYYVGTCPALNFSVAAGQVVTLSYHANKPPTPPTCTVTKSP